VERVTFCEFVKFVQKEAELANDPIFSPDALRRENVNLPKGIRGAKEERVNPPQ